MNIFKEDVYRFTSLSEDIQARVYSFHETLRFSALQKVLKDHKNLSLNERINSNSYKNLLFITKNFEQSILSDCQNCLYLKEGYILNRRKIKII